MIRLVIDVILLIIIAMCTWYGYRRGLIGGIASILAIVIALFGGSLLSSAYAHEVVPALEPFVDGFIDSQNTRDEVLKTMGYSGSDLSLEDILSQDSSRRYDYAYECILQVGFYPERAQELAGQAVDYAAANNTSMTDAVVAVLCDTITYVAGLVLAFLMILILLVALANMGNLSLRLPNMETLDELGGAGLGFVQGFIFCVLLCWALSFFGIVLGKDTLAETTLGRFFLTFKFITDGLL